MTKIHLHSPAVTNDGTYQDAGVDVTVGNGNAEINAVRAGELVDGDRAIDVSEAPVSAAKK